MDCFKWAVNNISNIIIRRCDHSRKPSRPGHYEKQFAWSPPSSGVGFHRSLELPTEETLEMLDKWVEHFGGDKAGAVDTLRKNPNLLLSEPSGPVEVTKALASFASLFDF